uniref:Transmembrane protein 129, E3 ubiquitin ligase n=1 Tax=Sphenodon punctatus TaxID=8508 RepID=A0A8D0HJR7_SPHPU
MLGFSLLCGAAALLLLGWPPAPELQAAGLTLPQLLAGWLGPEETAFVQHHLRRGAGTGLVHSLLPLGYYIGMCFAAPEKQLCSVYQASDGWKLFFLLAILAPTVAGMLVYYWSRKGWENHPLARTLALYAVPSSSWRAVASSINTEFRRIDKFASGAPGARVIVTDTWVIKVTMYGLHVAQQQDIHLTVTDSRQHEISPCAQEETGLDRGSVPSPLPSLLRLNSAEYGELREKLSAPIHHAANIVIHQSLSDLFLGTFTSLVESNPPYSVPSHQELEPCIGCMQTRANIKLVKNCREPNEGECQQCYCRPMWCLVCMGKWFASRQNQQHPETWLSSQVPCPTCRARFCILDVCLIQ